MDARRIPIFWSDCDRLNRFPLVLNFPTSFEFLNSNLHHSKEEEDEPITELDIDFSVTNLDY